MKALEALEVVMTDGYNILKLTETIWEKSFIEYQHSKEVHKLIKLLLQQQTLPSHNFWKETQLLLTCA